MFGRLEIEIWQLSQFCLITEKPYIIPKSFLLFPHISAMGSRMRPPRGFSEIEIWHLSQFWLITEKPYIMLKSFLLFPHIAAMVSRMRPPRTQFNPFGFSFRKCLVNWKLKFGSLGIYYIRKPLNDNSL